MSPFRFNEKYLSQIPALQLLINTGDEIVLRFLRSFAAKISPLSIRVYSRSFAVNNLPAKNHCRFASFLNTEKHFRLSLRSVRNYSDNSLLSWSASSFVSFCENRPQGKDRLEALSHVFFLRGLRFFCGQKFIHSRLNMPDQKIRTPSMEHLNE